MTSFPAVILRAPAQISQLWRQFREFSEYDSIIPRENQDGSKYKDNLQKFNNLKYKDNKRMKMNLRIKIKEDEDSPQNEDNLKHK